MGSNGEVTVRYAPYLEKTHRVLTGVDVEPPFFTMMQALNAAWHKSPYKDGFDSINVDRGFFGTVESDPTKFYRIESFPSLWDMFGKFMGGLDLHLLWGDVYEDVVHGPEVANSIAAHSALLRDEVDIKIMPNFLAGMRDINAIQSSVFIVGKALIYDAHTKAVSEFGANLRIAALDLSFKLWNKHLDWDSTVIKTYSDMYKLYFAVKFDNDRSELEYKVKDVLWDLGLFEYARAFTGTLNGAAATTGRNEPSQLMKSLSGTISGAATGYQVGGEYGAIAGAALGLAGSFIK